ncbi:hypothetical protein HY994_06180 [Candidatus Micrarchaeota archaeon]|nr:hypothetical protein [Candidatus Micrarchaeota archaeon]
MAKTGAPIGSKLRANPSSKTTPNSASKPRGQAAIEYVLLVSFGLFIVIVGFTLAFYIKNFTDSALKLVAVNRDVLLGFLLK